MIYQPLDADKDELRLVYFTQSKDDLLLSGIVQLELKTVSFHDFTSQSQEYMKPKGYTRYNPDDYCSRSCLSLVAVPEMINSAAESDNFFQRVENTIATAENQSGFGRWSWGDYTTLSYTWGDRTKLRAIKVNGHIWEVTENLDDFLRSYIMNKLTTLLPNEARIGWWIDALCINQKDIEERNQQVKRMTDIYQQSLQTVAWLGQASENSDLALDLLESIMLHHINTREDALTYSAGIFEMGAFGAGAWTAVGDFLCRPYWSRLWVTQEIAMSHYRLDIMLGDRNIYWLFLVRPLTSFLSTFRHLQRLL